MLDTDFQQYTLCPTFELGSPFCGVTRACSFQTTESGLLVFASFMTLNAIRWVLLVAILFTLRTLGFPATFHYHSHTTVQTIRYEAIVITGYFPPDTQIQVPCDNIAPGMFLV